MLQYTQCKVSYKKQTTEDVKKKVAHKLHILPEEIKEFRIVKKSIDARKSPDILFIYTVQFTVEDEKSLLHRNKKDKNLSQAMPEPDLMKHVSNIATEKKIVVVGAGPAGLFCAYYLTLCGLTPVVIERGATIEERTNDVERFWESEELNPESNVSFGEGGAGTFSDGKLNTSVKDKTGRKQFVLNSFVRFGARENILYDSKPHIGTDILRNVIINMREEMKAKGCKFLFHTKMTGLHIENRVLKGIYVKNSDGEVEIACDAMVLAIGHSARDTFAMLREKNVTMSRKAFAIGVRVQHNQTDIDRAQYGIVDDCLPVSPYKCTGKTKDGRGVYSFCMCPGGYVVNASSEKGGLVVNGMSNADRDSGNANSAIVVAVNPEDFGSEDCLAGVEFQREFERKMFQLKQGKIPVQCYGDFINNKETGSLGKVTPCVKGKWTFANLRKALPNFVVDGMIDGMEQFQKKIKGFAKEDTLLLGIETRTSSPVRIERDEEFVSVSTKGLYPCGEGAGYAGGIMSAAMDGLRVAMKIQQNLQGE